MAWTRLRVSKHVSTTFEGYLASARTWEHGLLLFRQAASLGTGMIYRAGFSQRRSWPSDITATVRGQCWPSKPAWNPDRTCACFSTAQAAADWASTLTQPTC